MQSYTKNKELGNRKRYKIMNYRFFLPEMNYIIPKIIG